MHARVLGQTLVDRIHFLVDAVHALDILEVLIPYHRKGALIRIGGLAVKHARTTSHGTAEDFV